MKNKIFLLLSLFLIIFACSKEDAVESTAGYEKYVNIDSVKNQGTNIYRDRLLSYVDKYDILTLYRFNPILYYYEIIEKPSRAYTEADEQSVGALLDVIDETFYQQIGDKAILKFSPLCVLLVSELSLQGEYFDCNSGLYCLTFSGANKDIKTWDKKRKLLYKNNVTFEYLKRTVENELIEIPKEFVVISEYKSKTLNEENYKEYGFVENNTQCFNDEEIDFHSYIKLLVSTPTSELTAEGGLLDPKVDTKGLIKRKYDVVVRFFKQHDIDLIKIGNYQIK